MYCQQVFYFTCNLYRGARPTSQCQNWRRADFDCSQWLQLWAFWSNRGLFSIMAKLYIMFKCFSLNFISLWFFLVSGCWQQNNRGFIYQRALPRARALRAVPTCACTKKRKLSWQSLILVHLFRSTSCKNKYYFVDLILTSPWSYIVFWQFLPMRL
jgi:hypothetical protein